MPLITIEEKANRSRTSRYNISDEEESKSIKSSNKSKNDEEKT